MFDHTSGIVFAPYVAHLGIITDAFERLVGYATHEVPEEKELSRFAETTEGQASIVVVFTAIVLESFIQNYAARKLGANFAEQHVDKMALLTKWLVVPRLAVGQAIPPDHPAMELLRRLIAARNGIAHLKAKNMPWESVPDTLRRLKPSGRRLIEAGLSAFECMGGLGSALCAIDPDEKLGRLFAEMVKLRTYHVEWPAEQERDD
jgi:hypothetical protein